jgi:hypothetical protein
MAPRLRRRTASLDAIADLIGSVDGLPADLTARKKAYLRATGYGQNSAYQKSEPIPQPNLENGTRERRSEPSGIVKKRLSRSIFSE